MSTRWLSTWVILLSCLCFTTGQAVAADAEEAQVIATLEKLAQASVKKDAATLAKLYRDDLTYGHSTGRVDTKATVLKDLAGVHVVESMTFSETTVRFYGPVAIAKGITKIVSGDPPGKMGETRLNTLWVLIKGPEGWQITARQPTLLGKGHEPVK